MTELTDKLMKQLHFVGKAGSQYMYQHKQRLTGQQRVLAILNLEDNLSQSYLQEVLDLRPSSLAELLKKLEDKELISRKEDANDKRIKRITLTDSGRKEVKDNAVGEASITTEGFFAGLSESEQQSLHDTLEKVASGWDEDFQKQANSFVDPMDRFQAMQKVRNQMIEKYGDDFENMSEDDARAFRKEMRTQMKAMGMRMPGHGHGHGPMCHMMNHGGFGCSMGPGRHANFRFEGRCH